MKRTKSLMAAAVVAGATLGWPQSPELATVVSKSDARTVELPGEFLPYLSAAVQARVRGYVERVTVDRGSVVKQGQLLAELSAPEMKAQIAEAELTVQALEAERLQAEAELAGAESTATRMEKAAETPGAVAGNEVEVARQRVAALKAKVQAKRQAGQAAEAAALARKEMAGYLRITAPFDGVVTERLAHPGVLVGTGTESALLVLQQLSRLRLVVAVPEQYAGGIASGLRVEFSVPAYPERAYAGVVARLSHQVETKTRTMAVELDVANGDGRLAPGMYPAVRWPVRRSGVGLFVPKTSVVTTSERTFVIRNRGGKAEWVDVVKGVADGDLVVVRGGLRAGDQVVRRGTDEIRDGSVLGR